MNSKESRGRKQKKRKEKVVGHESMDIEEAFWV